MSTKFSAKSIDEVLIQVRESGYHDLMILLYQVNILINKIRTRDLNKLDTTPEQIVAMVQIALLGEEASSSALAESLLIEPNSASALLQRMENQGLIVKKAIAGSRGKKQISLTKKGESLLIEGFNLEDMGLVFSEISSKKIISTTQNLKTIRELALRHIYNQKIKYYIC